MEQHLDPSEFLQIEGAQAVTADGIGNQEAYWGHEALWLLVQHLIPIFKHLETFTKPSKIRSKPI